MTDSAFTKAANIPMLKTLGITLVESGDKHAIMEVTVAERHANFYGGTHGGLLATLADTACFFSRPLVPSGKRVTTVNLNLNYMRPANLGERLRARAELIRLGKQTANVEIRITNETGKELVQGTAILMIFPDE